MSENVKSQKHFLIQAIIQLLELNARDDISVRLGSH